jgi:hypothetical protein
MSKHGYHVSDIQRGTFGEFSKITEEMLELTDAKEQGCEVMVLCELSDLYGAIRGYLTTHHPGITMSELEKMADITERAFVSGERCSRQD